MALSRIIGWGSWAISTGSALAAVWVGPVVPSFTATGHLLATAGIAAGAGLVGSWLAQHDWRNW